jgi:hypothetical protein
VTDDEPTPEVVDRYWHSVKYRRPDLPHDHWSFAQGFASGLRWTFKATGALTGAMTPQFIQAAQDLAEVARWMKDEDEHERAIAWAESNANAEEHAIRADDDLEVLPF